MPSSEPRGFQVPFHAAKYPRANRIPSDSLNPGDVAPLVFPEVKPTRRAPAAQDEGTEPSLEALEREMETKLEVATRDAFQQGYARAKEESEAGLETLREQTRGAFDAFRRALERSEKDGARDAVDLAILLAEHVLRSKLSVDADALMSALEPAGQSLEGMEPLTVVCDPATGELLRSNLGALQERLEVAGVQVEVDDSFEPGDAVLQRGASTLDARLGGRLEKLRALLLEQLGLDAGGAP
jgi:flagellar biosynthesis/type III secretory pathway protein FliH